MQLPKQYPLAVAVALAMNVQCYTTAWQVGGARKKLFNKEFMEKEFGQQHKKQLGEEITAGGYPDTGNGLYSHKLSYRDWYNFNILQRIHLNYVQNISLATTATLAAGLYQPRAAAYTGLAFMFGRLLYGIFYKKQGGALNKVRIVGALLCLAALLTNTGIFSVNCFKNFSK